MSQRISGCRCCNTGCPACALSDTICTSVITPHVTGTGCDIHLPTIEGSKGGGLSGQDFNSGLNSDPLFYPDAVTQDHVAQIIFGCDPATGTYTLDISLDWFRNGPATPCTCGVSSVQFGRWVFTGVTPASLVCGDSFFFDSGALSGTDVNGCGMTLTTRVTIGAGPC